jgi:hypothetical protein
MDDMINWPSSIHGEGEKCKTGNILVRNPEGREHFGEPGLNGMITSLQGILKKYNEDVIWIHVAQYKDK